MAQSTAFQENNFSLGVNEDANENAIPEGFVEKLENGYPEGATLVKRKGYELKGGTIPLRVVNVVTKDNGDGTGKVYLSVSGELNLAVLRNRPVLIYGTLSKDLLPDYFDTITPAALFASKPSLDPRRVVPAGGTETITLTTTETALTSSDIIAGVSESLSDVTTQNEWVKTEAITVNQSDFTISADIDNSGGGTSKSFYLYYIDAGTESSYDTYVYTNGAASTTWTFTPNLPNNNLIARCYDTNGVEIEPDSFEFDTVSGEVTITWGSAQDGKCVCIAAEPDHFVSGYQLNNYLQEGGATTITLPTGTADQSWGFVDVYTVSAGVYSKCFPDSYTISPDGSVVVQFDNQSISQDEVRLVWAFTNVIAKVTVNVPITTTITEGTDSNPQLCIYGISDEETFSYIGAGDRAGWVTGVDHYKTEQYSTLVATAGWNSFAVRSSTEAPAALMPSHYPFLRCRLSSATAYDPTIAPAFSKTDPGAGQRRSRGLWVSSAVSTDGYVIATSMTYDSGDLKLGIPLTSLSTVAGNGSTPSQVVDDTFDTLTITQAPYSFLVGTFTIKQHQIDGNIVYLWITVPKVNNSKYDSTNTRIKLGIFSDALEFESPVPFIPGDVLESSLLPGDGEATISAVGVRGSSRCKVYINGVSEKCVLSHNLQLPATRAEATEFGFRNNDNECIDSANLDIVVGDVVTFSQSGKKREVITSWAQDEEAIDIVHNVNGAVVTIPGVNFTTVDLSVGQKLLLIESGEYTGLQEIKELLTGTTFTIVTTGSTDVAGYIHGPTIEVDSEIELHDENNNSSTVSVDERWVCIEPPLGVDSTGAVIQVNPSTTQQFSGEFGSQPMVRSTMVNDTLFWTNGVDPVFKFDGLNWMNAGLPRWNAVQLYTNTVSSAISGGNFVGGRFTNGAGSASYSTGGGVNVWYAPYINGNVIYFPAAVAQGIKEGDTLYVATTVGSIASGTYLKVLAVITSVVDWILASGSGTYSSSMTAVTVNAYGSSGLQYASSPQGLIYDVGLAYKYYHRLQYIDSNSNRVSTGVIASQDSYISASSGAATGQKFLSIPKFGIYPYSSFELEFFRTVAGGETYYRVANIPLASQAVTVGGEAVGCNYSTHYDYIPDTQIAQPADVDPVSSAIGGIELPTQVYAPPIAKYITSIGGRLILAATTSTPKISVRFQNGTTLLATTSALNGLEFTLRKSNEDTGTTTDLENRVTFKLTSDSAVATSSTISFASAPAGAAYDTVVSITVSDGTKFSTGNWVYINQSAGSLRLSGWFKLADVTGNILKVNTNMFRSSIAWSGSYDGTISIFGAGSGASNENIPVYIGTDSNFQNLAGNTGYSTILQIVGVRLAAAMNAVAAQEADAAWYMAEGGFDFASGEINILFPKALSTTPELQLPATIDSQYVKIFGNGVVRVQNTAVGAIQRYRGSRVCSSYVNYPEMFENPDTDDSTRSSYIWDVNPADGQDITCVIPLLGTSTSQGSQLESILIIFKERSIYALNVKGGTPQLLETNGMGCDSPYSVSYIQNGLAFSNRAGVFMIDRNLRIRPIGDLISRSFEEYGSDNLALLQGHHHGPSQQYKLAMGDDKVLVASYGPMAEGPNPAWSTYSNHEVRGGWSNFGAYEVFASGSNRVFINRDSGTSEDYRDGADPITLTIDFRMTAFSDPTIRKQVRHVGVTYRNMDSAADVVSVYAAVNAKKTYSLLDQSSLSSDDVRKVQTIRYGLPNGRFNYLQLRLVDANLDQPIEVGGIQYRAIGLSQFGTQEAKQTSTSS